MNTMIDLRSDTLTMPSKAMLDSIYSAQLGDDVYAEDVSTNLFQEKIADFFGKETGLIVPSGTMANQIGVAVHTATGDEVICESNAHIYYYETAGPSIISRVQMRPVESEKGEPDLNKIEAAIREDIYYMPRTSLICLENTHNRHGGTVISLEYCQSVSNLAKSRGIATHLDGARVWNAVLTNKELAQDYGKCFDTINVCFSKGLGTPALSMILGTKSHIAKALKWRKILGGGMRQTGVFSAMCDYAFENNLPKLHLDNANAKLFASVIAVEPKIKLDLSRVQTNIVLFEIANGVDLNKFQNDCQQNGLKISSFGGQKFRAVFHSQMDESTVTKAAEILISTLN